MPTPDEPSDKLTVYADYVCPFCYLGKQSLEQYRTGRSESLVVEWHPFDLRSDKRDADGNVDHSIKDGKDDAYFEQVRENVDRLKTEYGADAMLDFDDVPDVDSLDAQVASRYVQDHAPDRWESFDDAIYEALWEDGRDIGDRDVLLDVATNLGLDDQAVENALDDETSRERTFEAFERAQKLGITGVPTFVVDDHVARGAVPPEHLQRLVEGETTDATQ